MIKLEPFQPVDMAGAIEEMKKTFLEAYAASGTVKEACDTVGIQTRQAYGWRKVDKAFAQEWDRVTHEEILPILEQRAIERANEKSDLMLIFLLKAYNRKLYDDAQIEKKEKDTSLEINYVEQGLQSAPNQLPHPPGPNGPAEKP